MEGNNQSIWQFTDHIHLQNNNFANLSLNDSIWSVNAFGSKRHEYRRNFDFRFGGDVINNNVGNIFATPATPDPVIHNQNLSPYDLKHKGVVSSDFNSFNEGWKNGLGLGSGFGLPTVTPQNNVNGEFNKGGEKMGSGRNE